MTDLRECKTCIHSNKGNCEGTEECHECMWKSKYEQEPCDDCISRKAVRDTIFAECSTIKLDIDFAKVLLLQREINALPPATPTQRWIPVSERLPEEFESVLVCYKSQGGMAQCVTERFENMDGTNRWSAMFGQKPIAWMPLPKPYKEESEDRGMTREEAIKNIKEHCYFANLIPRAKEALDMAIQALEQEPKTRHCKDCKYFEYDSVPNVVDGIPIIVAHEICSRWGDGCKTREDGYCFLYEPTEKRG